MIKKIAQGDTNQAILAVWLGPLWAFVTKPLFFDAQTCTIKWPRYTTHPHWPNEISHAWLIGLILEVIYLL